MVRNLLGILAVFAGALLLVAVTFSASTDRRADVTYVSGSEPKSLDPHIMTGQLEGRIADAIFEGLLVRDPKTLLPVPGVAREMPEVSADLKTYRFHLRPEARWSDGTPITAADFAWSWRRLQRPDLGAEYAYIHHMIKWAEVYNTYGVNAQAIRETVLPDLAKLRRREGSPEGVEEEVWKPLVEGLQGAASDEVPASVWQEFLTAVHANEALKNVDDPVLRDALTRRSGTLGAGELDSIAAALEAEAIRRQELFEYADAHYGIDEGVYVDPEDPYTLVVELKAPTPYFLDVVAFYSSHPVPRQVAGVQDEQGRYPNEQDWFLPDKIVSNGPFRIGSWRVNDRIRLVKSDSYWNADSIRIDTIDALSIENQTTALNLYLTDAADWIPGNYPLDLVNQLKTRSDFYATRGLGVYYYRFNVTRPPFDDPRVRLAFCMAVDRQLIVDEVMRLGQIPAYHLVPPDLADYGYERPESRIRYDPEAARRLLAEAGFPGGKDFPKGVGVLYNTSEAHRKVAEVVADHLRRNLGVDVTAYNQEWQAYQATTQKLDYWLARAGWIGDYVDPMTFMDMWVTNGGNNQTGWGDPVYDRLIRCAADIDLLAQESESLFARLKEPDRARALLTAYTEAKTETDRAVTGAALRMHCFREAEAILVQDAFPIMPVYFYVWSGLVKPQVKGFYNELEMGDGERRANLQDIHPLRGLRVER